ncbi:MAG: phosphoserine phosphatase SerB [Pseudomonadales bacterium]|nr:phosphoserine phosphatase SerB [Pseudomonadales bacterium]
MADDIVLINVSGRDKPGLMSVLTEILASHNAQLLDIGQAVIHEDLALGILVSVPPEHAGGLVKDTMFEANEVGSTVRISNVTRAEYEAWLKASGQTRYIITLLASGSGSEPLHAISNITRKFDLNIDTVRRLTDRGAAESSQSKLCVEMRVRGEIGDMNALESDFMTAAESLNFDFSVQEDTVFRRNRRLVAFDMDSTLIRQEVIDELARRHGVGDQVVAITEDAMSGRIDFQESFRRRAALLKGMPVSVLEDVAKSVELNEGARRLLRALKHFGYKTAVISGGFQYVGEYLARDLDIDYVYANNLEVQDGVMTGAVSGPIVDAARKAELLRATADREGIALQQTIAIGDGANDLPMLTSAGLGVAFHAKRVVKESAQHAISNFGLDAVLYLIGFSDRDIDQAISASE